MVKLKFCASPIYDEAFGLLFVEMKLKLDDST